MTAQAGKGVKMEDQKPKTRDQMLAFVTQQRVSDFRQCFEVHAKLFGGANESSQEAIDAHLAEFAWADGLMADALLAQQALQGLQDQREAKCGAVLMGAQASECSQAEHVKYAALFGSSGQTGGI